MKPISQDSLNQRYARGDGNLRRDHRGCPITDCSFQSTAGAIDHTSATTQKGMVELRTFRRVSREYFGAEATGEYLKEAIFFAAIACIAAWPVTVMMYELMRMTIWTW
jgi:hypothetical protein